MNHFLKLFNFEMTRFLKVFAVLIGLLIGAQIAGAFFHAKSYMKSATRAMRQDHLNASDYVANYGPYKFSFFAQSGYVVYPILICATVIGIYIFFIWYRDWFGKSTFIYRLLMLPTARIQIFTAKLCTILLYTFGLLALQTVLVPITRAITKAIIEPTFYQPSTLFDIYITDLFGILYPSSVLEFFILYAAGALLVIVIFTAILLERSYRIKGIAFSILYGVVAAALFITPFILQETVFNHYFYPMELMLFEGLISIVIAVCSFVLSRHLLKYKVTV